MTWLATIARNRAIDWHRAQALRRTGSIDEAPDVADPAPNAEALLLIAEATAQLHRCLGLLVPRQREALITVLFDGTTYADLAIRRGVPVATMKSRIRRGLMRLRESLANDI